jgi:hypothetical protein
VYVVALAAVLPLIVPELWGGPSGFRLGVSDPVLSVISATEQPLSIRSPGGPWAIGLGLAWYGLGYWHRRISAWETGLVLIGSAAVLVRLGNAWLDAAALVLPLARQLRLADPRLWQLGVVAIASLVAVGLTVLASLPPPLPTVAASALVATPTRGTVLADWRWAAAVQRQLGATRTVLASAGLTSESPDFWLRYLEVAQGHASWSADLRYLDVDVVVLEATDQQRAAADLVRASGDWRVIVDAGGALVAERVAS